MAAESKTVVRSANRIPVLDGIRGIAILLVMTFHFWIVGIARGAAPSTSSGTPVWLLAYNCVAGMGWLGVDLFFVLSGFLITGILWDSRESAHYFRVFYGRRTVRIFPLYFAALTIFFLLGPFVMAHIYRPALAELQSGRIVKLFAWTYLLNWYEGLKGWNAVAHSLQHFWSLSVEEQFYLVWPFLVLKLTRRRLMGACAGLMVVALILRAIMYWLHLPFAAYVWTICRMDSLAMGAIVALAARDPEDWKILLKWARRLAVPLFIAVIVGRFLNPRCRVGPGNTPTFFMNTFELSLAGAFFGLCIGLAVALHKQTLGHRVLASPILRFFGKYSYCLYVCHLPVIVIFAKAGLNTTHLAGKFHSQMSAVLAVDAIALAVSIMIALASWHLYEKQWLKLKNLRGLRTDLPVRSEWKDVEVAEPLFSIVIACYNHEKFIQEAVESTLRQQGSKEIIVVDDASEDRSAEILKAFGQSINFVGLSVNRGAAAARNHGASLAKGEYIIFLDGDDALMPWALKVYGRLIQERGHKLILGRSSVFYGDLPTMRVEPPSKIKFVEYSTFFEKDRPWVYNTSSLVVERAAFSDAGGWSEDIFYQDIQDLLNKLCVAGHTGLVLAPETVLYRMHSTNAVRRIMPFIEGIDTLLAKAKRGAYPGDRAIRKKRAAWFGGLIFYWAKKGIYRDHRSDGLRLLFANLWIVLLAVIRRTASWIIGRRPTEVLTLESMTSKNTISSHSRTVVEPS